jgi:peptidoglycan/LPS O-acetylase OafA/YrhL
MGIIRTLLAISVLITHSQSIFGIFLLNGDLAVTLFFIISGFLISLAFEKKYKQNLAAFYINRVLRVYPPYLCALLFAALIFYFIPNGHHNPYKALTRIWETSNDQTFILAIISNVSLFGANLSKNLIYTIQGGLCFRTIGTKGLGDGSHNLLFVPQAWTLPLELCFYFCVPILVKIKNWRAICIILVLWYGTHLAHQSLSNKKILFDFSAFFPAQLPFFMMGIVSFHIFNKYDAKLSCRNFLNTLCGIMFCNKNLRNHILWI